MIVCPAAHKPDAIVLNVPKEAPLAPSSMGAVAAIASSAAKIVMAAEETGSVMIVRVKAAVPAAAIKAASYLQL